MWLFHILLLKSQGPLVAPSCEGQSPVWELGDLIPLRGELCWDPRLA